MGKETRSYTRSFRQSNKSMSGNQGARNFSQQNRGAWHQRIINFISRGKGQNNGQS